MAKTKKKTHHKRRRRIGATSSVGGQIEMAVYVMAGAVIGEFAINTVNTMFGSSTGAAGSGSSDYVGDAAGIALGIAVPMIMKGPIGQGLGMGMVAAGALNLVQDAGLISGVPILAGNYSNMPQRRLGAFQTGSGAMIAGMNNKTAAMVEAC